MRATGQTVWARLYYMVDPKHEQCTEGAVDIDFLEVLTLTIDIELEILE